MIQLPASYLQVMLVMIPGKKSTKLNLRPIMAGRFMKVYVSPTALITLILSTPTATAAKAQQ